MPKELIITAIAEIIFSLEKDFSTIEYTQDANILFIFYYYNCDLKQEMNKENKQALLISEEIVKVQLY